MIAPGSPTGTKNVSRTVNVSPLYTIVLDSGRAITVRASVSAGSTRPPTSNRK